ncbi:hypothetical protein NDU88_005156 [Pleurodeles waltl]|uniref:Uncharacterized protein n=1 Tax=Pleurodeles waltl TaxID=8319 RepID=A0AAV7L0D9_PLEWA|nr:hypothetical protein NDU88_005156 [Pleurodeles waltl]
MNGPRTIRTGIMKITTVKPEASPPPRQSVRILNNRLRQRRSASTPLALCLWCQCACARRHSNRLIFFLRYSSAHSRTGGTPVAQAGDGDGRDAYARGAAGGLLLSNGGLAGGGLKRQQQGEESKENEGINGAGGDCLHPVTVHDRSDQEGLSSEGSGVPKDVLSIQGQPWGAGDGTGGLASGSTDIALAESLWVAIPPSPPLHTVMVY